MVTAIQFQKICTVPTLPDFSLATTAVAGDRSLLFLFVEDSGSDAVAERFQYGIGIFPRAKMDVSKRFRLLRMNGESVQSIDLPPLDITFPHADVFPDGKVLLASSRCTWRAEDDYDLNGVIFDPHT